MSLLTSLLDTSGGGGGGAGELFSESTNTTISGDVNGVNVDFVLSHTPIDESLSVYLNGIFQTTSSDYTLSSLTVSFLVAPVAGDIITVTYQY